MIYLIEYDRIAGRLVRLDAYQPSERRRAEEDRLRVELSLLDGGVAREVVLLEAANEDELRKTHRRYFERLDELLTRVPATAR